jgi:hypothetical protein
MREYKTGTRERPQNGNNLGLYALSGGFSRKTPKKCLLARNTGISEDLLMLIYEKLTNLEYKPNY